MGPKTAPLALAPKGADPSAPASETPVQPTTKRPKLTSAERADYREREGRMLARAIVSARSSHGAVAKALGVTRQYVDKMCAGTVAIAAHHRLRLPPSVLAQYGEQVVAVADRLEAPSMPWHHHAAVLVKELGEATNAHLQGADRVEAEKQIADVVRVALAWQADNRKTA